MKNIYEEKKRINLPQHIDKRTVVNIHHMNHTITDTHGAASVVRVMTQFG